MAKGMHKNESLRKRQSAYDHGKVDNGTKRPGSRKK